MHLSSIWLAMNLLLGGAPAYEPTSAYSVRPMEGWKVYVNKRLLADQSGLPDESLKLLSGKLYNINRVVPKPALNKLHQVPIWIELDNDRLYPCACYHLSTDWLRENGYNPEKVQSVEISSARRFLRWTHAQPWIMLHELSHAYHHRELGYDDARIEDAYQRAVASTNYDQVLRYSGVTERHYGLNNAREYFAESTEAYFGTNDYYPFTRAELNKHDPGMHRLLAEIWGIPPNPKDPEDEAWKSEN